MRYFFDTEFIEDGTTVDLISIGVVCEDGREFYAVSQEAQLHRASAWVRANVLPHLPKYGDPAWMSREDIRARLVAFTHAEKQPDLAHWKPEFWAYYADYDWVALCQLFGIMMNLPEHYPKFCMDLKQLAVMNGNPALPKQESGEHDALADARWNRDVYAFLTALPKGGVTP